LHVPEQLAGGQVQCYACGRQLPVPVPPPGSIVPGSFYAVVPGMNVEIVGLHGPAVAAMQGRRR
jgi:hypothetical protein